jgi:hypothetical protein
MQQQQLLVVWGLVHPATLGTQHAVNLKILQVL